MTALIGEEEPIPAPPPSIMAALEGSPQLPICVRPWCRGEKLSFPEAVLESLWGLTPEASLFLSPVKIMVPQDYLCT